MVSQFLKGISLVLKNEFANIAGMNLHSHLGRFRLVAFLEGLSFLVLLFIAMPLKYGFDFPEAVRMVGMAHGVLFVAYLLLLVLAKVDQNWNLSLLVRSGLVSILPFGTFYADKHWWKESKA